METNSSSYVRSDKSTFFSNVLSKICVLLSVFYWEIHILFNYAFFFLDVFFFIIYHL